MLRLEHIGFRYPGASGNSLHDVTLEAPDGGITGLAGPAGAGKSTTCLVAAGLAPRFTGGRATGSLIVDGRSITRGDRMGPATVLLGLQDPAGQLSMVADTVFEEVAFGPGNLGLPRAELIERSWAALELMAIGDLARRDPRHLSGGEQQLVVLAGLIAMRPRNLVLDEPAAHLDANGVERLVHALEAVAADGAAVLIAEQRTDLLLRVCMSVAVVASGNVVVRGSPRGVLADPTIVALGVPEPQELRLQRVLTNATAAAAQGGSS